MKRSTLLRRLMTISMMCENLFLLLITVIYIFRPQFYTDALISVFGLHISELPINDPDMTLLMTLYGGIVAYFIVWFVLKIFMDSDSNPLAVGIVIFVLLAANVVVHKIMYAAAAERYAADGADALAFYLANFQVMQYCGWANVTAFIFMLMAYAVARQRFADLD